MLSLPTVDVTDGLSCRIKLRWDSAAQNPEPPSRSRLTVSASLLGLLQTWPRLFLRCGKTSGLSRGESGTHELKFTSTCTARANTGPDRQFV